MAFLNLNTGTSTVPAVKDATAIQKASRESHWRRHDMERVPAACGLLHVTALGNGERLDTLQEYDPSLAEQTLQKSFAHSSEAQQAKKRTLLAELVSSSVKFTDPLCDIAFLLHLPSALHAPRALLMKSMTWTMKTTCLRRARRTRSHSSSTLIMQGKGRRMRTAGCHLTGIVTSLGRTWRSGAGR